ncbi:MAG: ADP-heptose:LPS heptosyltransferase [Psychromonas sp.]|jgi:ADP-heptose:LPS heptosyltransferase|uniref:glycosyltransferase family 9 protein n=1 Tax=Psychromonas sp. TaxID=1884585 RepID=UPI0039E51CFE
MTFKHKLRKFDQFRRSKMSSLETAFYQLFSNKRSLEKQELVKDKVKHILLIRNNKRIGNIYFLLPFVRQIRLAYPDARIDMMLNESWQSNVFNNLGINQFHYSHFSLKGIFKFLKMMKALRKITYDMILLPQTSAGDTIITALLDGRNKISSFHPKRNLICIHSVYVEHRRKHAALSSLSILEGLGHTLVEPILHTLEFTQEELDKGRQASQVLRNNEGRVTIAYFRGARGDKLLSEKSWLTVLSKFETATNQQVQWVEILCPDISKPINAGVKTFQTSNLRHLASVLKELDAFISCDTGPLHLADAAGASCIGLYSHTNPKVFGVIGENTINVLDIENLDAPAIGKKLNIF